MFSCCPSVCVCCVFKPMHSPTGRRLLVVIIGWLGSRVVSVLDSGAEGPGFKSQSRC